MADIRIKDLPNEAAPSGTDFVAIDNVSTRKTTITLLTEAGRPAASQAEAEAGTDPTKAMTPLTVKQAIDFNLTTPSAILRTDDIGVTVQAFSTKLDNLAGTTLSAGALLFAAGVDTWSTLALGAENQFLTISGGNPTWVNAAAGGDVTGPASSISGSLPTYSGTTGKVIQAGNPLLADLLLALRGPMPTIANSGVDAVNDIVFSAGSSFSTDATNWPMVATGALTKQLDAAWAVGTNAGGRMSAAAIANGTYHCYQIRRPDTGVVDFGFDVSATAPTLPANYTQYRRIGSILREAATIIPFRQDGDTFTRVTVVVDRTSTAAAASALLTLSIPSGISVAPLTTLTLRVTAGAANNANNSLGSSSVGSANAPIQSVVTTTADGEGISQSTPPPVFWSNTSSQIYFACVINAGTLTSNTLQTYGWVDTRGR